MCDVIFEDNHLLVAVKPQNIPVQLDSSNDADFLSMLKNYLKKNITSRAMFTLGLFIDLIDQLAG